MQTITKEHRGVEPDQWLEPLMASDNFMRARERRDIITVASLIATLTGLVLIVAAANLGNLVIRERWAVSASSVFASPSAHAEAASSANSWSNQCRLSFLAHSAVSCLHQ